MELDDYWERRHGTAFRSFWDTAPERVRLSVLTTALTLLQDRIESEDAKGKFQLLCPEIRIDRLERLASGEMLPSMIDVRVQHPEQCLEHDRRFVHANGAGASEEQVESFASERDSLLRTFLHDVITVVMHMKDRDVSLPISSGSHIASPAPEEGVPLGPEEPARLADLSDLRGPCRWLEDVAHPALSRQVDEATVEAVGNPWDMLLGWIQSAHEDGLLPADGVPMVLATAERGSGGWPSARMVLMKVVDTRGIVFYTSGASRKGHDMHGNPRAAVVLHWPGNGESSSERTSRSYQVRIEGIVERCSEEAADAYFASRSRASQLAAAAASPQSSLVPGGRAELERRVRELEARVGTEGRVQRPPEWTGFRIVPVRVEFWASDPGRLHDRIVFVRHAAEEVEGLLPQRGADRNNGRSMTMAQLRSFLGTVGPASNREEWRVERLAP